VFDQFIFLDFVDTFHNNFWLLGQILSFC